MVKKKVFCAVSHSSPRYVQVEYKCKLANISDFNQNIKASCESKLKFTQLKDICINYTQKLVRD